MYAVLSNKLDDLNKIILHDPTEKVWLDFGVPIKILEASKLLEVLPILEEVEDWVNQKGYYAAGFLSYEASAAFDASLVTHIPNDFPLVCFGIFNAPKKLKDLDQKIATEQSIEGGNWEQHLNLDFKLPFSKKEYQKRFEVVQNHIQIGDTYQVNLTFKQKAPFHGRGAVNCGQLLHSRSD